MSRTHLLNVTVAVEGSPDDVVTAEPRPGKYTIVVGSELVMLLDGASAGLCRAIGAAFDAVAELKEQAAIVALNTPGLPADPVHATYPERGAA
jgi:hypothetical protein